MHLYCTDSSAITMVIWAPQQPSKSSKLCYRYAPHILSITVFNDYLSYMYMHMHIASTREVFLNKLLELGTAQISGNHNYPHTHIA